MIFVIAGFLILTVSFIVALVSLVREQRKLDEDNVDDKSIETLVPLSSGKPVNADSIKTPETYIEHVNTPENLGVKQADFGNEHLSRPLFPWEEAKYQTGEGAKLTDEEEIERIRADLSSFRGGSQKQPEQRTLNDNAKFGRQITGEVSIADLKKSN